MIFYVIFVQATKVLLYGKNENALTFPNPEEAERVAVQFFDSESQFTIVKVKQP